jgi:hypothetical protein
MQPRKLHLLVLFLATTVMGAELPYAGKWKMNPAKSDFGQATLTYEQLPSGEMQATSFGQSFKFKMDGRDYPNPFGNTVAWKSLSATSWESTWKLKGKVLYTDTVTLSSDGKTLTVNSKGTKPNGETIDDTTVFQRVSGGPGLAGKWRTKNVKSGAPELLELTPSGTDGLTYKVVDISLVCETKLDGKDYPCTGPTLSSGWTVALTKSGARSFDWTAKMNGKVVSKGRYTVSADGKTLTESGSATGTNENIKVVYDRQ